jgi:hypothetical protein
MCRLRRGVAFAGQGLLLTWLGPVGLAIAMAGCAASSAEPMPASLPLVQADRAEMEDDGLPVQVAPPAGIRQLPDDPREPFSRNYGPRPSARMSRAEEDAVIARAITAHEMRRP